MGYTGESDEESMALDLRHNQNSNYTAAHLHRPQLLNPETAEKACADLCKRLGDMVPAGTATLKVFGVMASRAENIDYLDFHFIPPGPNFLDAPLPFKIDRNQEVMLLENDDQKAVRTSYAGAVSLFKDFWKRGEASTLIAASNLEWAIVVNEDGGVVYWQDKTCSTLDALSMPPATE